MPTKRRKGKPGKADKLFSELVRSKGRCEAADWDGWYHVCSPQLQTCHVIGRRYAATRTDFDNAICCCASAHTHFTNKPILWTAFVDWWAERTGRARRARIEGEMVQGDHWEDVMRRRADALTSSPRRFDWKAEVVRLQAITKGGTR